MPIDDQTRDDERPVGPEPDRDNRPPGPDVPEGDALEQASGVARGLLDAGQVDAVNARVVELLGPFGAVVWCPHGPDEGCPCRKPAPGMVHRAAAALRTPVERCAVVGDIGADVDAAHAAGALGVLVPRPRTLEAEVRAAPLVARDFGEAVDALLGVCPAGATA